MGIPVKTGNKIPLTLQLTDEDASAFVKAHVFDADKVELSGSPVSLLHDQDGHYINEDLNFPATKRVFAFYSVWTDALFTQRHPIHQDTIEDIFVSIEEGDDLLQSKALLQSIAGPEGIVDGNVVELIGEVEQPESVQGLAEVSDSLEGEVSDQDEIEGEAASDESLFGKIQTNQSTVGETGGC